MGKRSGGERQRRQHGKKVSAARATRRARNKERLISALRPWRVFRVK